MVSQMGSYFPLTRFPDKEIKSQVGTVLLSVNGVSMDTVLWLII